jgi:hypothetical protein
MQYFAAKGGTSLSSSLALQILISSQTIMLIIQTWLG